MKSLRRAVGAGAFSMTDSTRHTAAELLAILSARQLKEGQVVFAGVGVPLLAATLAQRLDCPGLTILFEGGVIGAFVEPGKLPPSTNDQRCTKRANMVLGSAEVLLLLQRGYVDVGFMGLAQMIVAMKHEKRRFVGHVDFITSPGWIEGNDTRRERGLPTGGMHRVVTDLALFGFDEKTRRMKVLALNPGVTREQVQDDTGFKLDFAEDLSTTSPPTAKELAVLRELDPERLYTA